MSCHPFNERYASQNWIESFHYLLRQALASSLIAYTFRALLISKYLLYFLNSEPRIQLIR